MKNFISASLWSIIERNEIVSDVAIKCDALHIDVIDNAAQSNFFVPDVSSIGSAKEAGIPLHIHLMTDNLPHYCEYWSDVGVEKIFIHIEDNHQSIYKYQELKKKYDSIRPAFCLKLDLSILMPFIISSDHILMMSTEVGVKGVDTDPEAFERLSYVRSLVSDCTIIEADGGNRDDTVPLLCRAGANGFTLGSMLFTHTLADGIHITDKIRSLDHVDNNSES